jgi:hypothetical protein
MISSSYVFALLEILLEGFSRQHEEYHRQMQADTGQSFRQVPRITGSLFSGGWAPVYHQNESPKEMDPFRDGS